MSQNDIRTHIFMFLLRVALFVITGVALHKTDMAAVQGRCPMLWELTTCILCVKCLQLVLCPNVFKILREIMWWTDTAKTGLYAAFFLTEIVLTSQSLNSPDCMVAASLTSKYPMLVFVSFAVCVYDGAYVLSHALYRMLYRR
jgi:hypothetical protein